ncbi:MAG: hypothetical protein JWQ97_1126, partial [Phenylobacterium sp.]|nr:hypothetical protein [Phenylobacterium sp.]
MRIGGRPGGRPPLSKIRPDAYAGSGSGLGEIGTET